MGERLVRRRRQNIILSLRGIAAVIATILAFILILMILAIIERLALG
jgi:hypothetical protein